MAYVLYTIDSRGKEIILGRYKTKLLAKEAMINPFTGKPAKWIKLKKVM